MTGYRIVTAAPPTPNGDLHLGHLSGPYSGADIYTRAARLIGHPARYITGSDAYQSYVPVKASMLAADPVATADGYADGIAAAFSAIGFQPDSCIRSQHSAAHAEFVREFVGTLHRNGALIESTSDCLYCPRCNRYLFEAYVTGGCPHCGGRSDGNSCEWCAWPNQCTDLLDPVCNLCGGSPDVRAYRRLMFPLSRYADQLRKYCAQAVLSPQLEALAAELLDSALPDIPVSHPTDWGLPVPVAGYEDQRLYVWVEMVPGYLAGVAEAVGSAKAVGSAEAVGSGWREVWNDPATEVVQFYGFDNSYFHVLLHPALLMAYDERLRLPDAQLTNEFYLLDDAKFSKSRGHLIAGADLLARVPADVVRFVLAHDRPEVRRTNFTWARFGELCNEELAGRWQSWLASLFTAVHRDCAGLTPYAGELTGSQQQFLGSLQRLADETLNAYSAREFSPQRAARCLIELVRQGAEFGAGQARLRSGVDAERRQGSIAVELTAARTLAQLASPVMPEFGRQLWSALGEPAEPHWDGVRCCPAGRPVSADPVFFSRIEDVQAAVG